MGSNYVLDDKLIRGAGLSEASEIGREHGNLDDMPSLPDRIRQILGIVSSSNRKPGNMICFIMHDNEDSILIVPLSEDYARSMRIIGQQVDLDLIMHAKNTLFF